MLAEFTLTSADAAKAAELLDERNRRLLDVQLPLNFACDIVFSRNGEKIDEQLRCWLTWTQRHSDDLAKRLNNLPIVTEAGEHVGRIINPRAILSTLLFDMSVLDLRGGNAVAKAIADGRLLGVALRCSAFLTDDNPESRQVIDFVSVSKVVVRI